MPFLKTINIGVPDICAYITKRIKSSHKVILTGYAMSTTSGAVSYTHLDVYKRQHLHRCLFCNEMYTFAFTWRNNTLQSVYYTIP